jgi:uncharacterized protein (TIGR03437 family)
MKTIILLLALCAFPASVCAQINVANYATGRGITAPGAVAVITGGGFTLDSYYTNQPGELPKDLGGVQVVISKHLAGLRIVDPDRIVCVIPNDVPLGWQQVEVITPGGNFHGWALIAHVAPGIALQGGHPQGLWNLGKFVGVLGYSTPQAGATFNFTATGFFNAREVTAFVQTETEYLELPVKVLPFAVPMAGLETVSITLPPRARGEVLIVFGADGFWSNEVFLTIQ